ncbi:GH92 family glycosyl hydrolase [Silvibacterium sp.]|uniref:GH92 family glycosyl hydrolase n=1 Tax=Silvibacterium sp. TaxID=1964179 RepID=UPI0039E2463D
MLSRRTFLELASLTACSNLVAKPSFKVGLGGAHDGLTQYVNIAIGTGGHGHTYPGATVPFGAVQLSPDTFNAGWDWCSGYHISDSSIMGFSHTHLSGTGCGDLLDVLLMPCVGDVKLEAGSRENPESGYRSRFSHDDEVMKPGYYSVKLKDYGVLAELTATERTGAHKYTFPASEKSHFILDWSHAYEDPKNPISDAFLTVHGSDTIVGGRTVHSWGNGRKIYFAMQFSKAPSKIDIVAEGTTLPAGTTEAKGTALKAVLHHATAANEAVYVKTGISAVSAENALKNIEKEQPGWDFDSVRKAAHETWEKELGRIRIDGGTDKQKQIFYTSLYHMMVAPTLMDDVDGRYRGMDGQIHQLDPGQHNFSTYSLWDTYRALHPSFTLFQPERVPLMVNSLITMAEQSPAGIPVWPLQGEETACMTGYHSASVMAEACVKNFPGIDWERAYKVMRKRNMDDDYQGLGYYRQMGYIPADLEGESVSKTLEYDYGDWACSRVAEKLGKTGDAELMKKRSRNYQHLFDPKTKFIRAKLKDGQWATPYDPKEMGHMQKWRDYTESNSWETTFSVQHDVKHYIEIFGGRDAFVAKLDELFNQDSKLPADAPPDIAGLVGMYAHGNEPCHHMAYLYLWAGQPHKTQARIRMLLDTMYDNKPDGLAGNEDCGQMSAWYVMSAMGLYAVDPASGTYVFGSPIFDKATITLAGGKKLEIETKRKSPTDQYIASVTVDGKNHDRLWIEHETIARGAKIVFSMSPEPNMQLGTSEAVAPPSLEV